MRNRFFNLVSAGALFAVLIFAAACSDTIPLGTDVLPDGDHPDNIFTDTNTIYSWTVREDSLRTDKLLSPSIGYMEDPIFGSTKASLLLGFTIPGLSVNTSLLDTIEGYYLDSVVLAIKLNDVYGDSTLPMGFTIYKMPSTLNASNIYYSGFDIPTGMVEVGRISGYKPRLSEEYAEDTILTDLGPQLRIRLHPFFGQSLLNVLKTDVTRSNELFRQYLPGLVIVPDETPGSILEANLLVNTSNTLRNALENSRIHLYYKNAVDTSLYVIFNATGLNLGINTYEHDYSSTNVESALASNNDEGDAVNYVQGLAGVKTKVVFPYLDQYPASTAVLKAELVITQLEVGGEGIFPPTPRLLAVRIDEDGGNENVSDYSLFPAGHFDGVGRETTLESGETVMRYRINISDYIQRVIKGNLPNDGMYITMYPAQVVALTTVNSSALIPHRVVIGGGTNTMETHRLKLDLTYTVLD